MRKIKKGDNVVVIAGKDKGKRGDVSRIVDDSHVVVNGINQVKKHAKPNPMKNQPGGIVTRELRTERFMKIVSLAPEVL